MYLLSQISILFYILVVIVESSNHNNCEDYGEVILVSVVHRHGARTPDKTYKNDPYKNAFEEGLGELTNEGKRQTFQLGRWLRNRYDALLTRRYSPALIAAKASDKDRVLMSAQCVLAGLYPPEGTQLWNEALNWQPIPVHTLPKEMDKIMAMHAPCPAYDKELKLVLESPEVKKQSDKYKYIVDILNKYTGETRNDWKYIANIWDTLQVQKENKLELPLWSKDIFTEMKEATVLRFCLPTWNKKLARLKTGPLLEELIKNIHDKAENGTKVMHLYSAHDTTITNLLNTLSVWDKKLCSYAACILLELRRDCGGSHYVTVSVANRFQLMYRPSVTVEPRLLTIPGCASVCPLDKFISITKPFISEDWDKECGKTQ